jgi:hypothetical protein
MWVLIYSANASYLPNIALYTIKYIEYSAKKLTYKTIHLQNKKACLRRLKLFLI